MNESTIYSIGHGAKTFNDFFEELSSFQIQYLIDVRSQPYSKWNPEFNKEILEQKMAKTNIRYIYWGAILGGRPNDISCYTDNRIDYSKLRQKDFFIDGISRIIIANEKQIRVAVMCSEANPAICHRSKCIGQDLLSKGISMHHIVGPNKSKSQELVMAELTKGLGIVDLFGQEESFMSIKEYTI